MNVPTLPGQTVQVEPLPSAYKSVPQATNAPILDAVGQAAQQFGDVAAKRAALLQAREDQTAVNNVAADAAAQKQAIWLDVYAKKDQEALDAASTAVERFRKWSDERLAGLSDRQREIATTHVEGLALSLAGDTTKLTIDTSRAMSAKSVAGVVQTNTAIIGTGAANGAIRIRYAPGSTGTSDGTLDETVFQQSWNAIESAIHNDAKIEGTSATEERLAVEQARNDAVLTALEGLLTPDPERPIDDRTAKAFYEVHKSEIKDSTQRRQWAEKVTAANDGGEVERAFSRIWQAHAGGGETWSEKQAAMEAEAEALPEKLRGPVATMLGKGVDAAREDDNQRKADSLAALDKQQQDGMPLSEIKKSAAWGDLTAAGQRMLEGNQKQDDSVYVAIIHEVAHDPEAFYKRNLLESYDLLGDERYKELRAIQVAHENGDDTKQKVMQSTEGAFSNAAESASIATVFKTPQARSDAKIRFTQNAWDALRLDQAEALAAGKPWVESEARQKVIDRLLALALTDKRFTSDSIRPTGTVVPEDIDSRDIPADILKQIKDRLGPQGALDDAAVREAYVYWLTFEELPPKEAPE